MKPGDIDLMAFGRDNSMTMREYYAGLAMQGMLAADKKFQIKDVDLAKMAVSVTDALIEELGKKNEPIATAPGEETPQVGPDAFWEEFKGFDFSKVKWLKHNKSGAFYKFCYHGGKFLHHWVEDPSGKKTEINQSELRFFRPIKFTQTLECGDTIRPTKWPQAYEESRRYYKFPEELPTMRIVAIGPEGFDLDCGPFGMLEHSDDWELVEKAGEE